MGLSRPLLLVLCFSIFLGISEGKHFVLVHGSCHGAWCWYKLQPLLVAAGHNVTAIDLGASGINPKQLKDIHSISDYFEPLFSFFRGLPEGEKVILVGHSRGGFAVGAAIEKFHDKVSVAVYATAYMIGPNFSILDVNRLFRVRASDYGPDSKLTYDREGRITSILFGPQLLLNSIYRRSPREDWTLATMLARPYPYFDDERALKKLRFTRKRYGSVKRVFIIAGQDTGITPAAARLFINHTSVSGVYEIPEADHMVMFSQPHRLSQILDEIAKKY